MKTQINRLDNDLRKAKMEIKDVKLGERFFQVDRVKDNIIKSKNYVKFFMEDDKLKIKEEGKKNLEEEEKNKIQDE